MIGRIYGISCIKKSKIWSEFQIIIGKGIFDLENDEIIVNEYDEYGDNFMCFKSQFLEEFVVDV